MSIRRCCCFLVVVFRRPGPLLSVESLQTAKNNAKNNSQKQQRQLTTIREAAPMLYKCRTSALTNYHFSRVHLAALHLWRTSAVEMLLFL